MRVLVTRPAGRAAPLKTVLESLGHSVLVDPLLEIRALAGVSLPLDGVAALLFTSGNGVTAFAALSARRDLPVYAVGSSTAAAARAAGFGEVADAAGDAADLVHLVRTRPPAAPGILLHAAGTDLAHDLAGMLGAAGFDVRVVPVYQAVAADSLAPATRRELADGALDAVLLFSPRSAGLFVRLAHQAGLQPQAARLTFYCLSDAVAAALVPLGRSRIRVAARPDQAALLDEVAALTKEPA